MPIKLFKLNHLPTVVALSLIEVLIIWLLQIFFNVEIKLPLSFLLFFKLLFIAIGSKTSISIGCMAVSWRIVLINYLLDLLLCLKFLFWFFLFCIHHDRRFILIIKGFIAEAVFLLIVFILDPLLILITFLRY